MNPSTKLTTKRLLPALILAALCSAPLAANAMDANYFVVVPIDSVGESASKITVTLLAATLPAASVGEDYVQDMNAYLNISGVSSYNPSLLSWSALSDLPDGITLGKDGVLSGTPSQAHEEGLTLDIQAAYRGKVAAQRYPITVMPITIALAGDSRNWSDGSYAQSCEAYRRPTLNYRYEGAIGTGVYRIELDGLGAFDVYCDMETDGGGWTTIQRRYDGSVGFYRGWNAYTTGFGDTALEHWIGLDRIHALTKNGVELRFDLKTFSAQKHYAQYTNFVIGSASTKYTLQSATWAHGSTQDAIGVGPQSQIQVGMKFTTFDADNDLWVGNCAAAFKGATWSRGCHSMDINGEYPSGPNVEYGMGLKWLPITGDYQSLAATEMKIR